MLRTSVPTADTNAAGSAPNSRTGKRRLFSIKSGRSVTGTHLRLASIHSQQFSVVRVGAIREPAATCHLSVSGHRSC